MNNTLSKRPDGKFEEVLGGAWVAEYWEDPVTGLWQVEIFRHEVPELLTTDFTSLADAQQAALDYYDQV